MLTYRTVSDTLPLAFKLPMSGSQGEDVLTLVVLSRRMYNKFGDLTTKWNFGFHLFRLSGPAYIQCANV